jgi:hypothetical protein
MKRLLLLVLVTLLVFATVSDAQRRRRQPPPSPPAGLVNTQCDPSIHSIKDCPLKGCTHGDHPFDPLLNERKDIPSSNQTPVDKDFAFLRNLPNPGSDYVEGGDRAPLTALGEGDMIRVVAFAVRVSKGSSETCNCQLTQLPDKDNHIVLIDPDDSSPSKADEPQSQTAEFTPRVRLDHPRLRWSVLNYRIENASQQALKVRVTGLLMFDSHHLFHDPLPRNNNWEIHPVFKLEYCPKFKECEAGSDTNWRSLE